MVIKHLHTLTTLRLVPIAMLLTAVSGCGGGGSGGGVQIPANAPLIVASFDGSNGINPVAVRFDSHGNMFGVAASGGAHGNGDVFEVASGSRTISDVADFNGANGSDPITLLVDSHGNVFGVTLAGGASGTGDVFEVAAGSHSVTDIADLNISTYPQPALVVDGAGNLFGIAGSGGSYIEPSYVFEVAAGSHSAVNIASLDTPTFGSGRPNSLVIDSQGNLFGTLDDDGVIQVFNVAPGSHAASLVTNLGFGNGYPQSSVLAIDGHDNLIGATSADGETGDVFEVPSGAVSATEVAYFSYVPSTGSQRYGPNPTSVTVDSAGNVFGTTSNGGTDNAGMVFKVAAGSSAIRDTADIPVTSGGVNGSAGAGSLVVDSSGNLFGVYSVGGPANRGSIFEVLATKVSGSS